MLLNIVEIKGTKSHDLEDFDSKLPKPVEYPDCHRSLPAQYSIQTQDIAAITAVLRHQPVATKFHASVNLVARPWHKHAQHA